MVKLPAKNRLFDSVTIDTSSQLRDPEGGRHDLNNLKID